MPPLFATRSMASADLAGVAALESENPSPWSVDSLAKELAIGQAIQLVAEVPDGQLLGWAACRVIWPEAELLKIAVKKTSRECGIGHSLLGYLFDELQKRKVATLFLEVRTSNRIALNFYQKHGFLHVGSRRKYYNDPPDDAMILTRKF